MFLAGTLALWTLVVFVVSKLWKLFNRYIVKSPLDVLPGPRPESFLRGETHASSYFAQATHYEHQAASRSCSLTIRGHFWTT